MQAQCPACHQVFSAEAERVGQEATCPACGEAFVVAPAVQAQSDPSDPDQTHDEAILEELCPILEQHFVGAQLPGCGCGVVFLVWIAAIVGVVVQLRDEGTSTVIGVCAALTVCLYALARWLERQRTANAILEADERISALCARHGIERKELFRIAVDVRGIRNYSFLVVIDAALAEQLMEREHGSG